MGMEDVCVARIGDPSACVCVSLCGVRETSNLSISFVISDDNYSISGLLRDFLFDIMIRITAIYSVCDNFRTINC